jgi:hypothetical protein
LKEEHRVMAEKYTGEVVKFVNGELLNGLSPIQIVVWTLLTYFAVQVFGQIIVLLRSVTWEKFKEKVFRLATYIPPVAAYIKADSDKSIGEFIKKFSSERKGKTLRKIPLKGLPR